MLIPGLSGSYLLIILGNYKLLVIDTINKITSFNFSEQNYLYLKLFFVFLFGQVLGILIFSRLIKWLIKNYKNITFSTLAGFIAGSLVYIWPWKNNIENTKLIYNLSYRFYN